MTSTNAQLKSTELLALLVALIDAIPKQVQWPMELQKAVTAAENFIDEVSE
jgi:hypothetical protein